MKNLTNFTSALMIMLITLQHSFLGFTQSPLSQKVQTEFGLGVSFPTLTKGEELIQSATLRKDGLSYYLPSQGQRKNVGSYSRLVGWSFTTAYYRPVRKVAGLMVGSVFRASLTGSEPSSGGYAEGFFFNCMSVGLGVKYYPFTHNNLFFKGDAGIATVLTKNRFVSEKNEQQFFHQFGIGTNASVSAGYSVKPFKNKDKSLDIQAVYQLNNTRVEVNGIGNDQWSFSALNLMLCINF